MPGLQLAARIGKLRPWLPWALAACLLLLTLLRVFLPAVGMLRDDGIYLSSARALAAGKGYVIDILPGDIPNTKYPPLTSALVAPLFAAGLDPLRHAPAFKAVPFAFLLLWLLGLRRLAQLFGLGMESTGWVLACTLASAWVAYCGTMILSDVPSAALVTWGLVFVLLSIQPGSRQRSCAAAAGLLLGLAFLTRTHAAAAIAGLSLYLLVRRHYWQLALICTVVAILGAPWVWWTSANPEPADPILQYYSGHNYRNWWAWNAGDAASSFKILIANLMVFLAAPSISVGLGAPILGSILFVPVLLLAASSAQKPQAPPVLLTILGPAILALFWQWMPDRLLLFVFPLLWLAAAAVARPLDRRILASLALLFCLRGLWLQSHQAILGFAGGTPPLFAEPSDNWNKLRQVGHWLAAHTEPGDVIGTLQDGAIPFLAGRKVVAPAVLHPLFLVYGGDGLPLGSAPELAAALNRFGIRFVVQTPSRSSSEAKEFHRLLDGLRSSAPPCLLPAADFGDEYRIYEFTCRGQTLP